MAFLKKVIVVFLTSIFRVLNRLGCIIHWSALIRICRYAQWKAKLKCLGKNVTLQPGVVIHGSRKVSIKTGTCIAEYVHMWGGGGIEIGENVLIASHSVITSLTHDTKAQIYKSSVISKKVIIEDNVWIGAHAIILPGIRIGRNAIIGAGAVVTKDVAANDVVAGVPATSIRTEWENPLTSKFRQHMSISYSLKAGNEQQH